MNSESLLDSTVNQDTEVENQNQSKNSPLENLIDKVDGQGTYQIVSNVIFNLMWLVTGWLLTGTSFFFDDHFECRRTFPDNQKNKKCIDFICSLPSPQARLKQILSHSDSIAFAFQPNYMICELDYQATILTSMIYVGSLVGFFIIPHLADNYGRKIMIHISWGICVIGTLLIASAPSPILVGFGFFFSGFGANPAITLNYSFINEQVVGKWRQRYGIIIQVTLGIGQATIGLFFIGGIGWREVFFIIFGLSLLVQLLCFYLLETPKFLITRNKQKTLIVLNRMAKRNKRPYLEMKQIQKFIEEEYPNRESQNTTLITENDSKVQDNNPLKKQEKTSASLKLLFKYKSLLWNSLGAGAGFLGIQIIYYSTTLNLDKTGYSKIINQEIVAISQIAGYITGQLIVSKVPRKKTSLYSMLFSSIMCLLLFLTGLFDHGDSDFLKYLQMTLLVANRFVLCCFWAIFYVYIAQLFPTKVRSLGYGWAGAMGTIGSSLAPYLILVSTSIGIDSWVPPGIIGLLTLILMAKLPQTLGKPLQDEIQEEKYLKNVQQQQ